MAQTTRTYPNLSQVTDPATQRTFRIIYDLIRAAEEAIAIQTKDLVSVGARITGVEPRVTTLESPQVFATSVGMTPQFVVRDVPRGLVLTSGSLPGDRGLAVPSFQKIATGVGPEETRIRLEHSEDQEIQEDTETTVTWDTEVYDPKNLHSGGSPTLITIATPGTYIGGVYIAWDMDAPMGYRQVSIEKNATDVLARDRRDFSGFTETSLVMPDVQLAATDTLRVRVLHNAGDPLLITIVTGSPVFWLRKVA